MPRPLSSTVHALAVLVERDLDLRRVPVDHLVDRVVDDLPEQVVVAVLAGAADVHGGPLANGLEALEDLDVFAGVFRSLAPCQFTSGLPSAFARGWMVTGFGDDARACTRLISW